MVQGQSASSAGASTDALAPSGVEEATAVATEGSASDDNGDLFNLNTTALKAVFDQKAMETNIGERCF